MESSCKPEGYNSVSHYLVVNGAHATISAGGTTYKEPQDHGFMYQHGFQDLDGHIWEIFFMEPSAVNQA